MTGKYDDIIHMEHPISKNHPQMPMINRAAQFAPFAAVSGHHDAIKDAAEKFSYCVEINRDEIIGSDRTGRGNFDLTNQNLTEQKI